MINLLGITTVRNLRCEVSSSDETNCPEPQVTVVDHHEGDLSDKLRVKRSLCIKSAPQSKPEMVHREVATINYSQRGEYLFTYAATDSSGNEAEEVQL